MNVVLIIDMLRGFMEPGHPLYCGDHARKIIPNIQKLLKEERDKGSKVIFLCDHHAPDDKEFEVFPPHCIDGTEEVDIIDELDGGMGIYTPKTRYSGFFDTDLEYRLEHYEADKLIVCGVCTHICVMHTVADARNRDYEVEIHENCVASFNETSHTQAIGHMQNVLGAKIIR